MSDSEGWIKLYRSTLKNEVVMKDAAHLAVWVWLLLHTQNKKRTIQLDGRDIDVFPGEFVTKQSDIAEDLGISRAKLIRVISDFKESGQVQTFASNRWTRYKIVNWAKFQWVQRSEEKGEHQNAKIEHQIGQQNEHQNNGCDQVIPNVSRFEKSESEQQIGQQTEHQNAKIEQPTSIYEEYTKNDYEERARAREAFYDKEEPHEIDERDPGQDRWSKGQEPDDLTLYDIY